MFDVGFWELIVIAVVALIVLGPERLPVVARKIGYWVGRMRRFVSDVKHDLDREMQIRDIRDALERDAGLDEIKKIIESDRYLIEDEISKTNYAVKARDDDPTANKVDDSAPPSHEEENARYGHQQHLVLEDPDDPPVQHENVKPPATADSAPAASQPSTEPSPTAPSSTHGSEHKTN